MRVMIVEADSVADYLNRYYKPSRRTDSLLGAYENQYAKYGYVCTSCHDNSTGAFIFWPHHPKYPDAKPFVDLQER